MTYTCTNGAQRVPMLSLSLCRQIRGTHQTPIPTKKINKIFNAYTPTAQCPGISSLI